MTPKKPTERYIIQEIHKLYYRGALSKTERDIALTMKFGFGWDMAIERLADPTARKEAIKISREMTTEKLDKMAGTGAPKPKGIDVRVVQATHFKIIREEHGNYLKVGQLRKEERQWDLMLPMTQKLPLRRVNGMSWYDVRNQYPVTEAGHVPVLLAFER